MCAVAYRMLRCGPYVMKGCAASQMMGTRLSDIPNTKQELVLTRLNTVIKAHGFQVFNLHFECELHSSCLALNFSNTHS
jgi:hypothetical protein